LRRAVTVVVMLVLLAAAGCSFGFNPFKQLGVSQKDIPAYEVDSEITDKSPPARIWATAKTKEATETQARQIAADYFSKKLKETPDLKYISLFVNTAGARYKGEYFKDEETAKSVKPQEMPQKYPAAVFSVEDKK